MANSVTRKSTPPLERTTTTTARARAAVPAVPSRRPGRANAARSEAILETAANVVSFSTSEYPAAGSEVDRPPDASTDAACSPPPTGGQDPDPDCSEP